MYFPLNFLSLCRKKFQVKICFYTIGNTRKLFIFYAFKHKKMISIKYPGKSILTIYLKLGINSLTVITMYSLTSFVETIVAVMHA